MYVYYYFIFKKIRIVAFYAQVSSEQKDTLSDVTLAVVGGSGCGKSTAIAKGLKAYGLSEPALVTDGPRSDDAFRCECRQASFHSVSCCSPHIDTVREGKIVHDSSADCTLRVLEVGTSAL